MSELGPATSLLPQLTSLTFGHGYVGHVDLDTLQGGVGVLNFGANLGRAGWLLHFACMLTFHSERHLPACNGVAVWTDWCASRPA